MNKEEEGIKILKTFKTRQKTINYNKISLEDVEAVETVLQALDNSIPKETIKVRKQKLEEKYKEEMEVNPTKAFIIKCQIEFAEEILEGKQ